MHPRDAANGLELLECNCGYNIAAPLKARIDELRAALTEACNLIAGTTQCESQYADCRDDPDWKLQERLRLLL